MPRIHLHGKEYFLRSEKVPQSDVGCFVLYIVRSRRRSSFSLLPGGKWKGVPLGARSRPHRESGSDRVRDNWGGGGGGCCRAEAGGHRLRFPGPGRGLRPRVPPLRPEVAAAGARPVGAGCPCRRAWPHTPVFLPGDSHGQRSLVGCSPWGHRESDTTEQLNHQDLEGSAACSHCSCIVTALVSLLETNGE